MPEIEWLSRWENTHENETDKPEIANMDSLDFATLLEEIEHR